MEYPTEREYAEAFGVDMEDTTDQSGVEEMGTRLQEAAHNEGNAAEDSAQEAADTEGVEDNPRQEEAQQQEMPPEERRRQAAARRAREEQARAAAEQARVDKIYADMFTGQVNPFTGKPIQTEAEYKAYEAEKQLRQQDAQLQKAGIDPGTIQNMVNRQLAPIQQRLQMAELAAMRERARTVNARAQEAVNAALKNISAMNPAINSLEDIAALSTAPRFNDLVQKGIGLEDAFYLANRADIDARRAAAAKAAAINDMANRRHLNPMTDSGGKLPVEIPKGVRETYLEMMPGSTDAEIQEAYESAMKNMK